MLCFTKGTSPYQSQLIITLVFSRKGHVPPCYQSQLIIMLWLHEARPSVLSITTHHHCCFHERGTSSVLSITTHHHVRFHERHVPPCYQSQLITVFSTKARPSRHHSHNSSRQVFEGASSSSVLSITTHHVGFSRGTSLRASITTHHHC
jgi:hypothetical protein